MVEDVLSGAQLFQPTTPEIDSTTLSAIYFGTGNSGSANRPTTSLGSVTVLWTNASRIDDAYVSIEILHAT
jgi:hypothetical protein